MIAGIVISIVVILLLFYVPKPQKRKPNFAWSLLCVAMFTLGLNLTVSLLGYAGMYCVENVIGMYAEVENEKTRMNYRNMLSVPVYVNFVSKAIFDTDYIAGGKHVEKREQTAKEKKRLTEKGLDETKAKIGRNKQK